MAQRTMDLSRLVDFVSDTLRSTEGVRNVLQSQCDEARYILKPWASEALVTKQIDLNLCTCERICSNVEQIEEIASGIGMAVMQAKQLREKLTMNISKEKKKNKTREPTVHEIYTSAQTSSVAKSVTKQVSSLKQDGTAKPDPEKENGCNNTVRHVRRGSKNLANESKDGKPSRTPNSVARTNEPHPKKNNFKSNVKGTKTEPTLESVSEVYERVTSIKKVKSKSVMEKKLLKTSPYNILASTSKSGSKSKPKKNFIAANKSSIKQIKPLERPQSSKSLSNLCLGGNLREHMVKYSGSSTSSGTSGKQSLTMSTCTVSTAELEKLISEISLGSNKTLSKSCTSLGRSTCPVHSENSLGVIQERVATTVDVVEGLDRYGVPPELVKVLKVYHGYLKQEFPNELPRDRRGEKAVDNFISSFNTMNELRRVYLKEEPMAALTTDFVPLFKDSHNEKLDFVGLSRLKIKYTDLDSICKSYRICKSFGPLKQKRSGPFESSVAQDFCQKKGWRLNGVWNDMSITTNYFQGMSRAHCIRYANSSQLLSLVEIMQRIQRLQYQQNLIELLIEHVIPVLRSTVDPTSKEYAEAYKMISIISDVLNPRAPVLVRTDE